MSWSTARRTAIAVASVAVVLIGLALSDFVWPVRLPSLFGLFVFIGLPVVYLLGLCLLVCVGAYRTARCVKRMIRPESEERARPRTRRRAFFGALGSAALTVAVLSWLLYTLVGMGHNAMYRINRARAARAQEEIHGIELALTAMLADVEQRDFFSLFNDVAAMREAHGSYQSMWNAVLPDLLRNGREAGYDLRPEVAQRMGLSYMADLGTDPWGNPYQFLPGPLTRYGTEDAPYWVRSFRPPGRPAYTDRNGLTQSDFYYDEQAASEAEADFPGAPEADGLPGWPAPVDMTIFIWSLGKDGTSCQRVEADLSPRNVNVGPSVSSGDDIGNWDSLGGWACFYGL